MLRSFATLAFSTLLFACGGNVVVDHGSGNAGGSGGSGGTISTGTVSTTGTSINSSVNSTTSTVSSTVASTGTSSDCPLDPHIDGLCMIEGQSCPMVLSCCGGPAICKGGRWHYDNPICNQLCFPCGPELSCTGEALCVVDDFDSGTNYHCVKNLCPGRPTCDDCGNLVCMNDNLSCADAKEHAVLCDCPTCDSGR